MSQPDARLALLALYAEDMFQDPAALEPAPDVRLTADGWAICGYLTGVDALLRPRASLSLAARRVFYGFLAESEGAPGTFVLVVRGTQGLIEWIEDAEFLLTAHPVSGRVEAGFWGIYQTFAYRSVGGADQPPLPAIAAAVANGQVTVVGHSLGSALATYLAYDLARPANLGAEVSARLFASPRPGDSTFAQLVHQQIADLKSYAYELDIVPRVPFGLGFAPLPDTISCAASAVLVRIKVNPFCSHHALSYCAILDPRAVDLAAVPDQDRQYAACIRGIAP